MLDPILAEIAAALAAKAAESLYDLVKGKFTGRGKALETLDAAAGAPAGSPRVLALAEELAMAEACDPAFSEQLRAQWTAIKALTVASPSGDGIANTISGQVTGTVVQARDIQGNISFNS